MIRINWKSASLMRRTPRLYSWLTAVMASWVFASVAAATPVGTEYTATVTNLPGNGNAVLTFDGQRKPIGASGLTVQEKLTELGTATYIEFSLLTQNGQPLIGQQQDPAGTVGLELNDLAWDDAGNPGALLESTAFLYFTADGEPLPVADTFQVGFSFATHPLNSGVSIVIIDNAQVSTNLLSLNSSLFQDTARPSLAQLLSLFLSQEDVSRVNGIHVGFAATEGGEPPPPPGENQPPTADAGPDQTVEATSSAGADVTLAGSGSDPDGDPLSFSWSGPFGTATGSGPTVTLLLGSHTLTLTVDDGNGGSDSDDVMITVVDTTLPALTVPADQTLEATGPDGAVASFAATATDIADPSPVVNCVPPSGSTFPLGTTTVTCTATDASGNHSEGSFNVTVRDTIPPSVTAPPDVTVAATGPLTVVDLEANGPASATDAVGVVSGPTPDNPGPFAPGVHTVTWSAGDAAGNSGSDTQTVTVSVLYNFSGFFPPVDDQPAINRAKAGQGVAIKWKLTNGDGGVVGDPGVVTGIQYVTVNCETGAVLSGPISASTAGQSGLHYDTANQQFIYVWKTPKSLAGQCADFILNLADGSSHHARFAFR
jgi:hypothetical protein